MYKGVITLQELLPEQIKELVYSIYVCIFKKLLVEAFENIGMICFQMKSKCMVVC